MGTVIKIFSDGSYLEYDRGSFDDWCVYLTKPGVSKTPPRDVDYFQHLLNFAARYGAMRMYQDYVQVYDITTRQVESHVLIRISQIASGYGNDALQIDILFSILYMAMIAEEQKKNTRLGKRIKRLGIHKLLMENMTVHESANFMRGMRWQEIHALCCARGF